MCICETLARTPKGGVQPKALVFAGRGKPSLGHPFLFLASHLIPLRLQGARVLSLQEAAGRLGSRGERVCASVLRSTALPQGSSNGAGLNTRACLAGAFARVLASMHKELRNSSGGLLPHVRITSTSSRTRSLQLCLNRVHALTPPFTHSCAQPVFPCVAHAHSALFPWFTHAKLAVHPKSCTHTHNHTQPHAHTRTRARVYTARCPPQVALPHTYMHACAHSVPLP